MVLQTTADLDVGALITVGQAARRLGVSPEMVRQWLRDQRLPHVTTALGRLIDPRAVEAFAEERALAAGGGRR